MKIKHIYTPLITMVAFCNYAAAQQRSWYVGIYLNPGTYQLYNKNDWNADSISHYYPDNTNINNITVGATGTLLISKNIGLTSALLYQRCKQDFFRKRDPDGPDPIQFLNMSDEFHFLTIPINFQFSTNNEATHQLVAEAGLQTKIIMKYKTIFEQRATNFYSESLLINKKVRDIDNPSNPPEYYSKFIYKWLTFGLNTKIAYRAKLNNGWLVELGVNGYHDFTNAENRKSTLLSTNGLRWQNALRDGFGGGIENRPKSYHRMLGAFVNISVPVSVRE